MDIVITPNVIDSLLADAHKRDSYWHGEKHWRGVAQAGWYLANADSRVDPDVVLLFAILHDSRRENENSDPQHGVRAAGRARAMFQQGMLPISFDQMAVLHEALRIHNGAHPSEVHDPTVRACLDADRLNLWRVGKAPRPDLLNTEYARRPEVRAWAKRLCNGYCFYGRKAGMVRLLTWAQLSQAFHALKGAREAGTVRVVVGTPHLREVVLQLEDLMSRPLREAERKLLNFGRRYGASAYRPTLAEAKEEEIEDEKAQALGLASVFEVERSTFWDEYDAADEEVRKFLR